MDKKQRGNAFVWAIVWLLIGIVGGWFVRNSYDGVTLEEVTPETKFEKLVADNLTGALVNQGYITGEEETADCCWPKRCDPTAYVMLQEVFQQILASPLDDPKKFELLMKVMRSLDPNLTTGDGIHVCEIQPPARDPCDELREDIYDPAMGANQAPDPLEAWLTIEKELDRFPGDR